MGNPKLELELELHLTDGSVHLHTIAPTTIGEVTSLDEVARARMLTRFERELMDAKYLIPVTAGGYVHPLHVMRVVEVKEPTP